MIEVEGKGGITAKIVAHSSSAVTGKDIITFELTYPRFVHSEMLTHRLFSRNAASSRAIPVNAMLDLVKTKPAMPIHWGANQPGMQAKRECDAPVLTYGDGHDEVVLYREKAWKQAARDASTWAELFSEAGYHKQIVNRLLEPFQMMKTVVTATEWDNFFHLRLHPDAQPEIMELARVMYEALQRSEPEVLQPGEWHTPYVRTLRLASGRDDKFGKRVYCQTYTERWDEKYQQAERTWTEMSEEDALKVSASCCAQVSYRKSDDSLEKALMVYDRLVNSKPVHASPFEHSATPMAADVSLGTDGVTAFHNTLGFMSGNFSGWVQHRQMIEDNVCNDFKKEE